MFLIICLSKTCVSFYDKLYFCILFHLTLKIFPMKKILLLLLMLPFFMNGQVNLTTTTYIQDFNSLTTSTTASTWADNTTIVGIYAQRSGTGTTIVASTGSSTGGTLYSFGTGTNTDRAVGSIGSSNVAAGSFAYGLRLQNNTGSPIASIVVSYVGEQWRNSAAAAQIVNFSYQTSISTPLTALQASSATVPSGFTAVTALDFTSPITAGTAGALDGNLSVNKVSKTATIIFTTPVPVGGEILLRWGDPDHTGTDHGLSVDDVSIVATPATPTLTVSQTTIPAFNYVLGNGPSTENSYTLLGSVLMPTADTIKILAPTNFEISKTTGSGFKDSLNILYTGGTFASTTIYTRLKTGLSISTYSDTIRHSGGGVISPPKIKVSGSVTAVPPPVITIVETLVNFTAFIGVPPTSQSYTVSGINLTDNITITPPAGYLVKTGAGAYASSLVLPQVSGNVATTTVDVRLIGTVIGTYVGNLAHTSMGVTPAVNIAITGTVGSTTPCGVSQKIRDVRLAIPELPSLPTATGLVKTMKGQITGVFGPSKFYMADSTGGIAVFMLNIVTTNNLAFGDSVQITGTTARFNGEAEMITITCVAKLATGIAPTPKVFNVISPPVGVNMLTFLDNNEGGYVKVIGINLTSTGSFTAGTNYPISACNNQGDSEIRIDAGTTTNIPTTAIPTVTQNVTGLVGHYITATQTVNMIQLFPNKAADFENSAVTCVPVIVPVSASCGPVSAASFPADSTLDVTCWNVEWLGNTTLTPSPLGPTNDAQQMTNALSVLNTVKSDIFCVEEVCDHKQFIARVKTDMPRYKTRCQTKYYSHFYDTPEVTTNATTFSQKVCFVYDSTVVTMVDTISLLADFYTYPANNWASGRLPFMFIGNVKIGNVTKQIHFVGLHAKSGSALADYNRRKQDVIDLKAKLDAVYSSANIIMLGDYNDDLDTSIAASQPSSYKNFVIDNVNYKQISRALSLCGVSSTAKYPDIIDHFLMSNEFGVIPVTGPNPVPSISGIYYFDKSINVSRPISYVANYTTAMSDHYPVNARFIFKLPPPTIESAMTGNWNVGSTWVGGTIPPTDATVIINPTHIVTVPNTYTANAKNVKLNGGTINLVGTGTIGIN
jgi:hypothetical protein